jgi:hypothetical protein
LFLAALKLIGGWNRAALLFLLAPSALLGGMVAPLLEGTITAGHLAGLAVLAALTYSGLLFVAEQSEGGRLDVGDRSLAGLLLTAAAILGICSVVIFTGETVGLELLHPMSVVILLGLPTLLAYIAFTAPAAVHGTTFDTHVDIFAERKGGTIHATT